ncbi:MAG: hypothetical protein ACLQDI_19995 [Syntrophobacteraceae bacterium]
MILASAYAHRIPQAHHRRPIPPFLAGFTPFRRYERLFQLPSYRKAVRPASIENYRHASDAADNLA